MKSHKQFAEQLLADPEIREEYDHLETEFSLLDELLKARELSGLSQADRPRWPAAWARKRRPYPG